MAAACSPVATVGRLVGMCGDAQMGVPSPGCAGDLKQQAWYHKQWQESREELDLLERHPWLFILKHGIDHGLGMWTFYMYILIGWICAFLLTMCLIVIRDSILTWF